MGQKIKARRVAILLANGFEQSELVQAMETFHQGGFTCHLVSSEEGSVRAWDQTDWGDVFHVDVPLGQARCRNFDILFLPGAVMNPSNLRRDPKAANLVCAFFAAGKPVAALCHGPWVLVNSGIARAVKNHAYRSHRCDVETFVERILPGEDATALSHLPGAPILAASNTPAFSSSLAAMTRRQASRCRSLPRADRLALPMIVWLHQGKKRSVQPRRTVENFQKQSAS